MKKKNRDMICPECNGRGETDWDIHPTEKCFYCMGTGIAVDDDSFEAIYRWEK